MPSLWTKKILALLHDPIEKARKIQGHEKIFEERARILGLNPDNLKRNADYLSSASDRISFPFEIPNDDEDKILSSFYKDGEFIHPLSGKKLNDNDYLTVKDDIKLLESLTLNRKIARLAGNLDKDDEEFWKKLYHKLWWELPKLYKFSYMLPADTRIPDHSIIEHLDNAAAFTIDGSKSLLMVSIGPVQEFIAAARKTIDMKVGSYLLSYLTFQGIKVIGNKYGYDSIIFPNMRGQYLLKKEFEREHIEVEYDEEFDMPPSVASLPNIFTAIVPTSALTDMKKEIEDSITGTMLSIGDFIKIMIKQRSKKLLEHSVYEKIQFVNNNAANLWDDQISQFPNVIFTHYDFKGTDDFLEKLLNEHFSYTKDPKPKQYFTQIKQLEGAYKLQPLAFYGLMSELVGIKSALRKATRDFVQLIEEDSLRGDDISGNNKALIQMTDKEDKLERLSALSTVKRFFTYYLENVELTEAVDELRNIVSTDEIAQCFKDNGDIYSCKLGILTMDGDKMGEWISGKRAPKTSERINSKIKNRLPKGYYEFLQDFSVVTPAYQRIVSRTLGNFSKFVPDIIEKYGGLLIYTGGDDVLALLPSNNVMKAANDLRKIYSGIGNLEIEKGGKKYIFKNGWCYLRESGNDIPKPIFNMMGEKATMSAGIVVCNKKFNLHLALDYARKAEKAAKNNNRNSFALKTIRRSGQMVDSVLKWDKKERNIVVSVQTFFDVIRSIKRNNKEKGKSLKDMILRLEKEFLLEYGIDDKPIKKDYLAFIVPYIVDKMNLSNYKDKIINSLKNLIDYNDSAKDVKNNIFLFMQNYEYSLREGDNEEEDS